MSLMALLELLDGWCFEKIFVVYIFGLHFLCCWLGGVIYHCLAFSDLLVIGGLMGLGFLLDFCFLGADRYTYLL